jgi:hypothetical protein
LLKLGPKILQAKIVIFKVIKAFRIPELSTTTLRCSFKVSREIATSFPSLLLLLLIDLNLNQLLDLTYTDPFGFSLHYTVANQV